MQRAPLASFGADILCKKPARKRGGFFPVLGPRLMSILTGKRGTTLSEQGKSI